MNAIQIGPHASAGRSGPAKLPYRRSVITDEISQDLDRAIAVASAFGLQGLDIRSVWGTPIHELDDAQLRRLADSARAAGLEIPSVAPPFWKCEIDDSDECARHKLILERALRAADRLGARVVRGFTFWRKAGVATYRERIVEAYREVLPLIERSGLIVGIENEPSCMLGTAAEVARLVDELGSPAIQALWDPANGTQAGERAYPEGFLEMRSRMVHIHLKDGRYVKGAWQHAVVGDGEVGLVDVSRALADYGYAGWVTLETHYRPSGTAADFRLPGGETFSELGEAGTVMCLHGWNQLLAEAT